MAKVVVTLRAAAHLARFDESQPASSALIKSAVLVLADHPLIGRVVDGTVLRELVISYGKTGFVALYRFRPKQGLVLVLSVRHRRQAGYP